jgi:DNA-binding LacI/PurR family transcriptional regulator
MQTKAAGRKPRRSSSTTWPRGSVSVSTVSRSLAGRPAISTQTREAVQAVAAELGYRIPTQGRRARGRRRG